MICDQTLRIKVLNINYCEFASGRTYDLTMKGYHLFVDIASQLYRELQSQEQYMFTA